MTLKETGTNDVTLTATFDSLASAQRFVARFGGRARDTGTLEIVSASYEVEPDVPDSCTVVVLRYRHTCKKQGNHYSDARRFFANAADGGELDDLKARAWTREATSTP
jgi:hypothetical protein